MRRLEEALNTIEKLETPESPAAKTAKTTGAECLGPHRDLASPVWVRLDAGPDDRRVARSPDEECTRVGRGEAVRRKEQYRGGNRRAYRLTSSEMEEVWRAEFPVGEGIVEDHPLEED
jgi:hypothetical protein